MIERLDNIHHNFNKLPEAISKGAFNLLKRKGIDTIIEVSTGLPLGSLGKYRLAKKMGKLFNG